MCRLSKNELIQQKCDVLVQLAESSKSPGDDSAYMLCQQKFDESAISELIQQNTLCQQNLLSQQIAWWWLSKRCWVMLSQQILLPQHKWPDSEKNVLCQQKLAEWVKILGDDSKRCWFMLTQQNPQSQQISRPRPHCHAFLSSIYLLGLGIGLGLLSHDFYATPPITAEATTDHRWLVSTATPTLWLDREYLFSVK